MDLFPKKYDALAGKIGAGVYVVTLIVYGIYATSQGFYIGKTKAGIEILYEGVSALFMTWGVVLLFSGIAGLAFSNRKYALIWLFFCLFSSISLFIVSFIYK